jgi:tetratricopeptide (TPR) repeat protein
METKSSIEPPDCHFLSAAIGWLELGNPAEAESELRQVSEPNQSAEEVLVVHWYIHERKGAWEQAREIAQRMRQTHPGNAFGYIHYAYATRRMTGGGLQAAWNALEPAVDLFPKEPIIPYNLACYAAQLDHQDQAWDWLQKAMAVGDKTLLRKMALADTDLKPLWPRLAQGSKKPGKA